MPTPGRPGAAMHVLSGLCVDLSGYEGWRRLTRERRRGAGGDGKEHATLSKGVLQRGAAPVSSRVFHGARKARNQRGIQRTRLPRMHGGAPAVGKECEGFRADGAEIREEH